MKKIVLFWLVMLFSASNFAQKNNPTDQQKINLLLDTWHKAAGDADFELYFSLMTSKAVFIGTDATENWQRKDFETFAKPYFDKGKAWNFKPLQRNIYVNDNQKMAWFDELLDTQMKICRGSGVLIKIGNQWKIQHYVLSMTVPNDNTTEVVKIKTVIETPLMESLKLSKK